jgi:hypothetical protein
MSSAVQGCLLKIRLHKSVVKEVADQVIDAQATLKEERGGRMVPLLDVVQ